MDKLLIIRMVTAVIMTATLGLLGLGLIASSQGTEAPPPTPTPVSRPLPTQGYYENCAKTESGAEIDCSQVEWPE